MVKAHDLTGVKIRNLKVLHKLPSRKGVNQKKTRWQVLCFCGQEFPCDTGDLTRSDGRERVSCGCINYPKQLASPHWKSPNEISSTYWSAAKKSASHRRIEFTVDIMSAHAKFIDQGSCCALTGDSITLNLDASLDRIDSSKGYVQGNIQWLHKDINRLKSNWSEHKFIEMCRKVAQHNEP